MRLTRGEKRFRDRIRSVLSMYGVHNVKLYSDPDLLTLRVKLDQTGVLWQYSKLKFRQHRLYGTATQIAFDVVRAFNDYATKEGYAPLTLISEENNV